MCEVNGMKNLDSTLYFITDSTGFAEEEFTSAFKLYNRTVVRPIQRNICDSLDKIFGVKGSVTITPFNTDNESKEVDVE